jgi:tetratricopeptide (TPR) repeat protein
MASNFLRKIQCANCKSVIQATSKSNVIFECDKCKNFNILLQDDVFLLTKYLDVKNLCDFQDEQGFSPQYNKLLKRNVALLTIDDLYKTWNKHAKTQFELKNYTEALFAAKKAIFYNPYPLINWMLLCDITSMFSILPVFTNALIFFRLRLKEIKEKFSEDEVREELDRRIESILLADYKQALTKIKTEQDAYQKKFPTMNFKTVILFKMALNEFDNALWVRTKKHLLSVVENWKENGPAWSILAKIYIQEKEYQKTQEAALQATRYMPKEANAWIQLFMATVELGDYMEARKHLIKVEELVGRDSNWLEMIEEWKRICRNKEKIFTRLESPESYLAGEPEVVEITDESGKTRRINAVKEDESVEYKSRIQERCNFCGYLIPPNYNQPRCPLCGVINPKKYQQMKGMSPQASDPSS